MGGGDDVSVAGAALRRAAVARFATAHPGELIVASGAFAYALGYINLRLAGAGLGVAPADLAVSTHDPSYSAQSGWIAKPGKLNGDREPSCSPRSGP
jgi:hypothetical protein